MFKIFSALKAFLKAIKRRFFASKHKWRIDGIGLDGSVFEVCESCTRVRIYLVDRDGEPISLREIDRLSKDETAEQAVLRVFRSQAEEPNEIDN